MEQQGRNLKKEEDMEKPVPANELEQAREMARIVGSAYRHVEHQQAADQVAGVADEVFDHLLSSGGRREESLPSTSSQPSITPRIPSLPHSTVCSEGSGSLALQLHYSGTCSIEPDDAEGRDCTVDEILDLPPSLDTALKLNMALQISFSDKIKVLQKALKENHSRQEMLKNKITAIKYCTDQVLKWDGSDKPPLRISHFAVPYFKNRSGMNAPMNEDAKFKVDNGYLDLYTTRTRPWTVTEQEVLGKIVREDWKDSVLKTQNSQLRELQRRLNRLEDQGKLALMANIEALIVKCKEKIETTTKTPVADFIPAPGGKLDWEKIAAQGYDGHRSSQECRLQWENFVHPSINCTLWTEKEDLTIQEIMMKRKNPNPDWELIAMQLDTNRTGLQVMQRWVSFINPTLNPAKWNPEMTRKLIDTVNMLRIGSHIPWAQVHQHMVGFSRNQVQNRWRMINPDQSKGPFTVEEDFILIKGLHMFGLNFSNIAHFMPGRSPCQVRERYKRTLLRSLASDPWSRSEDDILIRECQVGPRNWRKMVMMLPKRDACQIRNRYHTIQVWQTITGTNMAPPPLFPVSMTVNPIQVKNIRKHMILESNNIKEIVDISRKGMNVTSAVKELEQRRLVIKARKAKYPVERLKHYTEQRGRRPGANSPRQYTLQDSLLLDFFTPGRNNPSDFSNCFKSIQPSLTILSKIFQLRILREVTPSEEDIARTLQLSEEDLDFIQELVTEHNHSGETKSSDDCEACSPPCPEAIPLLPPSLTTQGALWSYLVHRPKLIEMASREFIFFKATKAELAILGPQPRLNKLVKRAPLTDVSFQLQSSNSIQATKSPNSAVKQIAGESEVCDVEKLQWNVKPSPSKWHNIVSSEADAVGRSDIETSDRVGDQSAMKIHITLKSLQKKPGKPRFRNHNWKLGQSALTTYSRGKTKPDTTVPSSESAGPSGADPDSSKQTGTCVNNEPPLSKRSQEEPPPPKRQRINEEVEAEERSENLLFQRMLSIFYWPAMMTLVNPPQEHVQQVDKMMAKKELNEEPSPPKVDKPKKMMLTKDELDIEEQEMYIHQLSQTHQAYQAWMNHQKKLRLTSSRRNSSQNNETSPGNTNIEDPTTCNQPMEEVEAKKENEVEACLQQQNEDTNNTLMEVEGTLNQSMEQCRGRGRNRGRGRGSHRGKPRGKSRGQSLEHNFPQDHEPCTEEELGKMTCPPGKGRGLAKFRRKQNLTSLRRSLVMKKIWEARREGIVPQRTSNREKRNYQPRASRTRDKVRKEMIKPPKAPNPWDLPLNGPMKVQPQVPLDRMALIVHQTQETVLAQPQETVLPQPQETVLPQPQETVLAQPQVTVLAQPCSSSDQQEL